MISIAPGLTASGTRTFSIAYRLEFLREWDGCIERGSKIALLRENSLDSNTVKRWINARERGEMEGSMVRASRKSSHASDRAELARLREENQQLQAKVAQSEAVQQILGKAYELLEGITQSSPTPTQIPPALLNADEYAEWLRGNKLS